MASKKSGTTGQLYRNTGSWASPSWSALKVRDLKFSDKYDMFDTSDRTINVNTKVASRANWSIEFEFIHDSTDTGLVALITASQAGTGVELLVTDDAVATSGTKGLRAEWTVESGYENDMKLTDGEMVKMTMVPYGNYTNAPTRWTT